MATVAVAVHFLAPVRPVKTCRPLIRALHHREPRQLRMLMLEPRLQRSTVEVQRRTDRQADRVDSAVLRTTKEDCLLVGKEGKTTWAGPITWITTRGLPHGLALQWVTTLQNSETKWTPQCRSSVSVTRIACCLMTARVPVHLVHQSTQPQAHHRLLPARMRSR